MRGKVIFGAILFLLLFGSIAYAQAAEGIDISRKTLESSNYIKTLDDIARYELTITNNLPAKDHFRISFLDESLWTILTSPEISYKLSGFDLDPGESITFTITIRPKPQAIANGYLNLNTRYLIDYEVLAEEAKAKQSDYVTLYYGPGFSKPRYPAVVLAEIEMPSKIDPRQDLEIRVILENRNPLNITALNIDLKSELITHHEVVSLGPIEEKTVLIPLSLDPLQEPMSDTLEVSISFEGENIQTDKHPYEIIAYSQFEEKQEKERETFYKTITHLSFRNNGNIEKVETVSHPVSWFETIFMTAEPKATMAKLDGKRYLTWQLQLAKDETKTIKLTKNYLPLLIILLLAILAYVAVRLMKGVVSVHKQAVLLAKSEGGISGVKVILKIKNVSSKPVHEVEVVDSVPNIVEIDKNVEMGHIAPINVVDRGKLGILIKWKLGDIEPGEERIVSYKAKARLTILGSFTLPAAVLRCIQGYKEKLAYSNRLRIKL